jgi:hypothetical protein
VSSVLFKSGASDSESDDGRPIPKSVPKKGGSKNMLCNQSCNYATEMQLSSVSQQPIAVAGVD